MKTRAFTAWHSSYFIEYGNNVAFIWVNQPVVTDDSDSTLVGYVSDVEKRIEKFIASFRMFPAASEQTD